MMSRSDMNIKFKLTSLLTALVIVFFNFRNAEGQNRPSYNKKYIHTLKDKKGNFLGKVYIEDFKNDVFKRLLITKQEKERLDTLYFISDCFFMNPKGIDLEFDKKTFNGYKIERLKDDTIQLFGIGKGSSGASDPAVIVWNDKKKIFQALKVP